MSPISTDVIGMIASFLQSGERNCGRLALDAHHKGQEELARVLQVSKAVRGHCLPLLYKDCVVDNYAVLADSLDGHPNHPIQHAQRLHFMQHPNPYVDIYDLLLAPDSPAWPCLAVRADPGEDEPALLQSLVDEPLGMAALAQVIYQLQDDGVPIFPRLQRVNFSADTFNLPEYDPVVAETVNSAVAPVGLRGSLSYIFLDTASVKHYCQYALYGPLALRPFITNVSSPPDIVTFHLPRSYPEIYPQSQIPVILGATNRYVFGSHQSLMICGRPADKDAARMLVNQALAGLLFTLQESDPVFDKEPSGDRTRQRQLSEVSSRIKQTKLEIYGAIHYKVVTSWGEAANAPKEDWSKSESLALFQTELDQMVGKWKGQVVLKHREECPPCSACDLDCQQYWMATEDDK